MPPSRYAARGAAKGFWLSWLPAAGAAESEDVEESAADGEAEGDEGEVGEADEEAPVDDDEVEVDEEAGLPLQAEISNSKASINAKSRAVFFFMG